MMKKPESINELREILCEEIHRLRKDETTAANVNAITNATGKVLSTIKMEMEYAKMTNTKPKVKFLKSE